MLNNQPYTLINLRNVATTDALAIVSIRNTAEVLHYLDARSLQLAHETEEYMLQLSNTKKCFTRVITYNEIIVGVCYLKDFNPTHHYAFITFYLHKDYWGKGIMKKALTSFLHEAFTSLSNLNRIEAQVHEYNLGSCALLQSVGFIKEGVARSNFYVNNTAFNSHIYAILRND
jgi:[ribosomal protein S5]-alanine N-acetyltransferase